MDLTKIKNDILQFGLSIIALEATDYLPSYAHSVGFEQQYHHPEIIVFGLPPSMMQELLNDIGSMLKEGKSIEIHRVYDDFFENGKVYFVKVDHRNKEDYFGYAVDYYQNSDFSAIELIWTDRNHKFPWEEGFEEEFKFKQPLLDRNADFKFSEEKDLKVSVSKNRTEGILKVMHMPNGEWNFYTENKETCIDECEIETLVKEDPTINQLFDLDYGQFAERKSVKEKWERKLI
jgi:hypothetical protein